MKKVVILVILALFAGVTANKTMAQKKANEVVCFKSNMDCENCKTTLTEYLKFEKGVKDLKVDYVTNTVYIEYKKGKNTEEGFAKAIEKKGYTANKISTKEYKEIVAEKQEQEKEKN